MHKLEGWWIHKKCEMELNHRLLLIQHELPNIQVKVLFGDKKLLENAIVSFHYGDSEKISEIREQIKKRAWELFEMKYGNPSWMEKVRSVGGVVGETLLRMASAITVSMMVCWMC